MKRYTAILEGEVSEWQGVIDLPMKLDYDNRPRQMISADGKQAITRYQKVNYNPNNNTTRVRFYPQTGRTHQLRVHSAITLNAPIVGDNLCGKNKKSDPLLQSMLDTNNLFLFAYKITFQHPRTKRMMTLRATVPEFMLPVMKLLEFNLP